MKITSEICLIYQVKLHLEENGIEIRDYSAVSSDVSLLASKQLKHSETKTVGNGTYGEEENNYELIWADPGSCCYALYSKLDSENVLLQQSPLALAKALKVTLFTYLRCQDMMIELSMCLLNQLTDQKL